jgi:hypothetical protein
MSLTLSGDSPKISADGTGVITSGTAVTASGTQVNFTGIPSWVKRITVMFNAVSTNGSSTYVLQIGSGSVTTSGYASVASAGAATSVYTSGFLVCNNLSAASFQSGIFVISTLGSNVWVCSGSCGSNAAANVQTIANGNITLGGVLDRIRITTVNGTDTFDAGSINILYE